MNQLTTAETLSDPGRLRPSAAARPGNTRVFRRAIRHSRHVRLMRVAIPITLAVMVFGVIGITWFDPSQLLTRLPLQNAGLVISGTKITMAAPKLTGYTRDSRWYELTATAAAQDITNPEIVELQQIRAKLEMQDKSTMDVTALDGVFDRKAGQLTLGRDILLQSTSGYEIRLNQAVIDTAGGNIVSEQPVEVKMLQGTLNANRLQVKNSGEVVLFEGGVTLYLLPQALDQTAAGPAPKP